METETERTLAALRSALRGEPRFARGWDVHVALDAGSAVLEGEVASVAVKKLLLARAAAQRSVVGVVDRLRVAPARRMGDCEIRDRLLNALLAEPALAEVALREIVKGSVVPVSEPMNARGDLSVRIDDGVVTLDGSAPSLAHQRLAGVLAWWIPGVRDVVNGVDVRAPEEDTDDEITDAVRTALEKDPFVDPSQVRVRTRVAVVTLEGLVPKDTEREMAELDAWYVLGVERVENHIAVHPGTPTGTC
jgi:osmotically-inducible protein OsmY